MCGRFAITLPDDAMARLFGAPTMHDVPPAPRYNVCPTAPVAALVSAQGQRHLGTMRWGFIPRWYSAATDGPLLFNARSETLAEKPAFSEAARQRRCLIPASGFFEWTKDGKTRLPWYITRRDGAPMVFAGVWQRWHGPDGAALSTCAIVTAAARGPMADLHDRVPVIVNPDDWPLWLGEAGRGAARLLQPPADDALRFHRVSAAINANTAEGPELIEPLDA